MKPDYKKAWRAKPGNKEAENEAHRKRRDKGDERLLESCRDTIRNMDRRAKGAA